MQKRLTVTIFDSKALKFEHPEIKKIEKNITNKEIIPRKDSENKDHEIKLFGFLKNQRRNSLTTLNPMDELIEIISKDLKSIQNKNYNEDIYLANSLIENSKDNFINGRKIKLVEIIFYILKKNQKSENDKFILKLYFLKFEKLMSLLLPLKVNLNDMLVKLVCQIKCEKRSKNTILFKSGDIGEKLYILLKGNVGILITKEKNIECTPLEFIKYLILLHLYQENTLLYESINKNKAIINFDEKRIICMLHIFKFYYFLKENNRLNKSYNSIYDFILNEQKINIYIFNKFNYQPILSLDLLGYERSTIDQLYSFYSRKIKDISRSLRFGLTGSALLANFIKKQINPILLNKPQTQSELLNHLKLYDEGKKKFKNEEEYFQKISFINEISYNKILLTNVEKYIERLESNTLLEIIKEDTRNNVSNDDLISEQNEKYKIFEYYEINQLFDGNIFGELALSDPNNRRTATVITKEDCYFGTLIKQVYDQSLRSAQEKLRLRNILFFTRGPIFKGISSNIFLNKFFYTLKKKSYKKGDIIFKKGEKRNNIIFVEKGELEISGNMTLYELTKLINKLGGILDDKYLNYLCNNYYQLNKYYFSFVQNIKFCVLKDKEIIGLDDLTIDDLNIFDCKCVSTDKTEIYEMDYITFIEAKKNSLVNNNIVEFVNMKRKFIIKMLLQQRNSLISYEINKIKKNHLKIKNLIDNKSQNNNMIKSLYLPITKNVKFYNKKIILSNKKKKGGEDIILLTTKNSKSLKKLEKNEKSKNLNTLSTRDIDYEKNNSNLNRLNNIQKFNLSSRNSRNSSKILSTIKSDKSKENKMKNKNNKNLKIKKSFFNRKITLYDNNSYLIKSAQLTNSNMCVNDNLIYYNKNCKPYIKEINHSRTRKKLIPFLSYSNSKKVKGVITPLILKEYQKKFPELRNDIKISNFYIENQNIFESLLYKEDKKGLNQKKEREKSKKKSNKGILYDKKVIYSYISKEKERNNDKNISNENSTIKNKANQTDTNFYKSKKVYKYKAAGIIDFLCLDNWEEKEHFQKNFFSSQN